MAMRSACLLLAALPHVVGRARAYARDVLAGWRLPQLTDTVELLVSELVTNAVKAADAEQNPIYLCLSIQRDVLLIEVWDANGGMPVRRTASDDDEEGRGLMLVRALSKEWGCRTLASGGKIVWCACPIEP